MKVGRGRWWAGGEGGQRVMVDRGRWWAERKGMLDIFCFACFVQSLDCFVLQPVFISVLLFLKSQI